MPRRDLVSFSGVKSILLGLVVGLILYVAFSSLPLLVEVALPSLRISFSPLISSKGLPSLSADTISHVPWIACSSLVSAFGTGAARKLAARVSTSCTCMTSLLGG